MKKPPGKQKSVSQNEKLKKNMTNTEPAAAPSTSPTRTIPLQQQQQPSRQNDPRVRELAMMNFMIVTMEEVKDLREKIDVIERNSRRSQERKRKQGKRSSRPRILDMNKRKLYCRHHKDRERSMYEPSNFLHEGRIAFHLPRSYEMIIAPTETTKRRKRRVVMTRPSNSTNSKTPPRPRYHHGDEMFV